jgi:hypothetical protein
VCINGKAVYRSIIPRGLIRRDPPVLSVSALVVACFGIAVVLPWLFDLRGSVAKIVVLIGSPVLTTIIGMALRITPVDNPVAFLVLFGGVALLLTIAGRAWQARARSQFSSGDATNLLRTNGDTPQPNPTQEEGPAYLRSKESTKPEREEAGEDTGRKDSGSEASTTIKTLSRSKFLRGLGSFALLVGLFLFFGMGCFGIAWEIAQTLWLQAPWVAIPRLATPDREILPFIIAVIYSAPFFALGCMMSALGYILIRFSRRAAHGAWLLVPVAAWLLVPVLFLYGFASWIAGMVGYFRFLLG